MPKISLILISLAFLLLSCAKSKKNIFYPSFSKEKLESNSTSIVGVGPIPEFVLDFRQGNEFQTSEGVIFVIFSKEVKNKNDIHLSSHEIREILKVYLSRYFDDYIEVAEHIKLLLSGKYWQLTKGGNYQYFERYVIPTETLKKIVSEKTLSKKAKEFFEDLLRKI